MTAMIGGADCAPARLTVTRGGWHLVAEHMPATALTGRPARSAWFRHRAAFGNAPFGAARIFGQAGTVAEAAALAGDGRERVLAHAATISTGRTS